MLCWAQAGAVPDTVRAVVGPNEGPEVRRYGPDDPAKAFDVPIAVILPDEDSTGTFEKSIVADGTLQKAASRGTSVPNGAGDKPRERALRSKLLALARVEL
jgi:hypothetical protein